MAQIPVKGKGQKDGGRRKGKAEGKEGKRDYAKQVVKFPGENLFPFHQNTSDKRHPERESKRRVLVSCSGTQPNYCSLP